MGRKKMSAEAITAAGRTHIAKSELKDREDGSPAVKSDNIRAPDFLLGSQPVREFDSIAAELADAGIMSNLDCNALGMYVAALYGYKYYSGLVNELTGKIGSDINQKLKFLDRLEKTEKLRDNALKQCRALGCELGLTPASRCRLVAPKSEPRGNKFSVFEEDGLK